MANELIFKEPGPSFDGRCVSLDPKSPDGRCPDPCLPDSELCAECLAGVNEALDWMQRMDR